MKSIKVYASVKSCFFKVGSVIIKFSYNQ